MAKVNLTTENSIVNAVGKMAFTGNVIPESWYKTVVSANGRVNLLAVKLVNLVCERELSKAAPEPSGNESF